MAKAAIMGFGTVGSGVYEIIRDKNFKNEVGEDIEVGYILDIRDFDDEELKPLLTKDFFDILNDDEVCVVAEVMGGLHPAYEFTKQLLQKGVSVVTSNKELVATYGPELLEIAKNNNAMYLFEASVGGGIPIIRPMTVCTKANNIEKIAGILNGTTNYILNEMFKKGKSFDEALSEAQEKGYAEKNPSADVDGHDACRKIAILSSMAWGDFVDYNNIKTQGIRNISQRDVAYANELNSVIKLIGYSYKNEEDKIYASVSPMLVSKDLIISNVDGVFNAVMLKGDSLGDAMFYGKGAGKLATASAVVADIIDCTRHNDKNKHNILWRTENNDIMSDGISEEFSYFVRASVSCEDVEKVFKNAKTVKLYDDEIGFVVENITKSELDSKLSNINLVKNVVKLLKF